MMILACAIGVSACDMVGGGKVKPVIKKGPPVAALEAPEDIERVAALVPKDNSYANKTTSISLTISGTCISQSVAVAVSVTNAEVKVTLDCDGTSGAFGSTLDLSSVPDGEVEIGFGFLKSKTSTTPIYELTRLIIKDTEVPPTFTVPGSLSESGSGAITISPVDGAALYQTTFTPSGGGAAIGPVETTTTSVPVTGLTVGTSYTVAVSALDAAGNKTDASNTGTFTRSAPPDASGLTATTASASQINLSWTSGGGSTAGYKIAYQSGGTAPASCSAGTVIAASSITGTSRAVTGLSAATQYSFRVCAINSDATPTASSGVIATATTLQAAPPNPTGPSATAMSTSRIDLSWTSGGGTTAGYRISYMTGATAPATCALGTTISESSITGTPHQVTSLSAGTQYSFRICAINGDATPTVSTGVTVTATTFQAAPPDPTSPSATPASSSQINLSWTSGGGSTVDYRISYATGASAPADCASGTTISESSITGTSHQVTGLSASTQYSFLICAINGNATPDVSSGVSATATTSSVSLTAILSGTPAAKSSASALSVTVGGTGVTRYKFALDLVGSISCANGADYYALDSNAGYDLVSVDITSSLMPDGEYLLCVVGGDDSNNWQGYASATSHTWTKDTAAPTPGAFEASSGVSDTGFTLNWGGASDAVSTLPANLSYYVCRGDSDTDIDSVSKCESPSTPGVYMVMNWTANTLTKAVSGLTASTTYHYRVIARDEAGNKVIYAAKSQATSASGGGGGGGGSSANDINLTYFVTGSSTVGYMYGPPGGTMTDNPSYASASAGALSITGAALTLDYNDTPWISLTASDGSQYLEVGPSGSAFNDSSITATSGDTGIVSIKGASTATDKVMVVSGWTAGDNSDFRTYHKYSTKTGSGAFAAGANIDNPAITFGDPAPRSQSIAADASGNVHYVATETNQGAGGAPLLTYWIFDGSSWGASTAGGNLNKTSDGSATCDNATYPAIAFDRAMSAHGIHIVYDCYLSISGHELVHLWHDGAMWQREQISTGTMSIPSSSPANSRVGFAVDNGRAIVAYWGSNGSLKVAVGTFSAGSYSWSASTLMNHFSGITYHTPQVGLSSTGLGRVVYMEYNVNVSTPQSDINLIYETSANTWNGTANLKSMNDAISYYWIGSGLGITGMAGNSRR